jgi:hypothetical protein
MMKNSEFTTLEKAELIDLIRLKVSDLGFSQSATVQDIYMKAAELGLELCPPEVGPQLRLNYSQVFNREQPINEWFYHIAMKPLSGSDGNPYVFGVNRDDFGRRWLSTSCAKPDFKWIPRCELLFRSRKLELRALDKNNPR